MGWNAKLAVTLCVLMMALAAPAWAQEQLEVSFDLNSYTDYGSMSFSQGCLCAAGATGCKATSRTNYVHVMVVWIEDDAGNYVTTLYRWGRTYIYNLKTWALASNMAPDGMTEATPSSRAGTPGDIFSDSAPGRSYSTGAHDISWLPDGDYRIHIESTQCELADEYRSGTLNGGAGLFGPTASFAFTKGRTSITTAPANDLGDAAPFMNVTVNYVVPGGNTPPGARVTAPVGAARWLMPSVTPSEKSTTLTAAVDDEGSAATCGSGGITCLWQRTRGSDTVVIDTPTAASTAVTFDTAGIYAFRFTAGDGTYTSSDEVTVYVNAHELEVTHDAEVATGNTFAMGLIENTCNSGNPCGPWVWGWGPDGLDGSSNPTTNHSRGFLRFDVSSISGPIVEGQMWLTWAEGNPDPTKWHDFYLMSDAEDDWNGTSSSTDWEGTITRTNQPIKPRMLTEDLDDPTRRLGAFQHTRCPWKHAPANPSGYCPNGTTLCETNADCGGSTCTTVLPGSQCPSYIVVELDGLSTSLAGGWDGNDQWSIFMTPRTYTPQNGMGLGSNQNLIKDKLILVEFWQDTPNQAPTADAGTDRVVADTSLPRGVEDVTFDGSGSSDPEAGALTYTWREGTTVLGTSSSPTGVTRSLAFGPHDLELTVTDVGGLTDTDTVQVIVEDRFHPNRTSGTAASITGTAAGQQYDDLYAYTPTAGGDWYKLSVVDGSDITVDVAIAGGDLDVRLLNSGMTVLDSATTTATTETVTDTGLTQGTYYVEVYAPSGATDATTYSMTVTVTGPSLAVAFSPTSATEDAGTLSGVGTVSVGTAVSGPLDVTLSAAPAGLVTFPTNPVTILTGNTSVTFDMTLVDDPVSVGNVDRSVTVSAVATTYNPGSADFDIIDNDTTLAIAWDRAQQTVDENASTSLIFLDVVASELPAAGVDVAFTVSGTATEGEDYSLANAPGNVLTISGSTTETLRITLLDDSVDEADETLILTITSVSDGAVGALGVYTLTITDDDEPGDGTGPDDGGADGAVEGGCSCRSSSAGVPVWLLLATMVGLVRRRWGRWR